MGGLIELVLASLILGWGFWELRSHRRYKRELQEKARQAVEVSSSTMARSQPQNEQVSMKSSGLRGPS